MPFNKVDPKQSFPKLEEEILKFWEENKIFEKSVEKNPADKPFVFYEGPPTANGTPGLHHVLARAFKDIIPRYKTMKGFRVERKAGWDTHGLPVELQVEKELGLKNKQEIENIIPGNPRESIIEFNKKCKESVWKYKDQWEKLTERMAYWVDMKNPYVTYENRYIESVWWVIAQIFKTKNKKGESLVYKGHKVVPYCYRCGTTLSSHEVAQGYQKVKDNSVFVKFKAMPNQKIGDFITDEKTYFLVWTTTPWTLPGNVALAIGEEINYALIKVFILDQGVKKIKDGQELPKAAQHYESYIIAKEKYDLILGEKMPEAVALINGKDLLRLEYEPLYSTNDTDKKAYYVVEGDFVTTQEGTGIVHIAPAFGEDDARVGRENDLPTLLTVDEAGKINVDVPGKGILVKKKNDKGEYAVDHLIIEDLKKRKLLFKEEKYEHDYPFCWRCDTPLIYYAKPSWFIRMSELSDELVKNNENINWIPEHIKEGRFGEWLRGVKDWAISRERYWGTPLPIWACEKCGEIKAIESIEEIKEQLGNPNKLFLMRHGEAENNAAKIMNSMPEGKKYSLTEKGKEQVVKIARELKNKNIAAIFSSPIQRTKETAEIIAKELGLKIIFDERLRETDQGSFNGKNWDEFQKNYPDGNQFLETDENGMEGFNNLEVRIKSFLDELNGKYQGKEIVIVSHGDPLRIMEGVCLGLKVKETIKRVHHSLGKASVAYSKFFDLHKPFIDDIKLECACGGEMQRVQEVLDVWFDSGSMPLAQFYYPNQAAEEDKKKIESGEVFPADYISEAIDQTRGWFYTLHAIATLLNISGKVPSGNAYKKVICLGHILDAKGKKMSKSRGNIVDPMKVMDEYGADMLRWMLFTINQPGLPKRFDIKSMRDIMNRVFRMLWNSYSFFVMYANIDKFEIRNSKFEISKLNNLLDRWIVSELNILIKNVDEKLEAYDIYSAAGMVEKFIDNLSNWYIRRSRKRFWKSEDDEDKNSAYQTLHYVLVELSKLMAPFTPFVAEEIYRNLQNPSSILPLERGGSSDPSPILPLERGGDALSVHLAEFPVADEKLIDEKLNEEMEKTRGIITEALQLRAKAGVKVRQPLSELRIKNYELSKELLEIIKEEVNIKEVIFDKNITEDTELNTELNTELIQEGQAREIIRFIQEMRKEAGYEVDNRIKAGYVGMSKIFDNFGEKMIKKEILADELSEGELENSDLAKEFDIGGERVKISIKK